MKRYWALTVLMMGALLAMFLLVEWLDVPLLADPGPLLARAGWIAAASGLALLVGDVFLPVPSSLVMVANGALFGVATGALLSAAGSLGAAWVGFWIGRRGGPLLERVISGEERARAGGLLERWGPLAVLVTRPVPIVAETVAILAGTSPLSWQRFSVAALAGSLPAAVLYALTGATTTRLDSVVLVLALVLLISGGFWLLGRRQDRLAGSD